MTSRNLLTTHSYHFGPPAVLHSLTNVRRCIALIFTTTTLLLLSSTNLLGIKEFCELMTSCNLLTTHSYHFGPPAVLPVVDRNHYFESGRNRNSDGRIRPEPEPEPDFFYWNLPVAMVNLRYHYHWSIRRVSAELHAGMPHLCVYTVCCCVLTSSLAMTWPGYGTCFMKKRGHNMTNDLLLVLHSL